MVLVCCLFVNKITFKLIVSRNIQFEFHILIETHNSIPRLKVKTSFDFSAQNLCSKLRTSVLFLSSLKSFKVEVPKISNLNIAENLWRKNNPNIESHSWEPSETHRLLSLKASQGFKPYFGLGRIGLRLVDQEVELPVCDASNEALFGWGEEWCSCRWIL